MRTITNQTFDEERALYGSKDVEVLDCRFDGPADGESAFKECSDIALKDCYFNLRYPFWHDKGLKISGSEMTEACRAALWYTEDAEITDTKMHGIKALRECANVRIKGCDIISPEFGWSVRGINMEDTSAEGEYFMLRSDHLTFDNVKLKGKYSFQYITDSVVKGEYLAWYCENVTFENCTLIGTQPLCYCKGLKLINCRMVDCDLAFEKSDVEAEIVSDVLSIKNPRSGRITAESVGEIIMDDPEAEGKVYVKNGCAEEP